jgi:hypothetical protein
LFIPSPGVGWFKLTQRLFVLLNSPAGENRPLKSFAVYVAFILHAVCEVNPFLTVNRSLKVAVWPLLRSPPRPILKSELLYPTFETDKSPVSFVNEISDKEVLYALVSKVSVNFTSL